MPDLSEALIQRYSSPESFRRGQGYYRQGAVASLTLRGQELRAKVAGSQFAPYGVRVNFDEAGIIDSTCSCPYEWGGPCKHDAEAALVVGERGLSLEGRKVRLAGWVSDLAEGLGRREIALEATLAAFHADPRLASYLRVWELAGEAWPEHRGRLLDHLRQGTSYLPTGQVDVFLHENLVGDAISAVEGDPFGGLVARVADAAIETHPDWVIETCRRQAEEIMNQGRSKDYDKAVDWLAKVRDAYLAAGREEEWLAHLAELIDHHQRKYKLRPMLEDLK